MIGSKYFRLHFVDADMTSHARPKNDRRLKTRSPHFVLIQVRIAPRVNSRALCPGVMVSKKRGNSKREPTEDTTEASTTAIEHNTTGAGVPAIHVFSPPDEPPSSDTGTPLPDDPGVLKENVKGLKSQLRRHKRQVLADHTSTAQDIYAVIVGR